MRFLFFFLVLVAGLSQGAEPELLEPEKAFRFAARVLKPDALEVRYQIAPGYYMYRDKFRFTVAPAEAKVGEPQLPPGQKKKDQFFGDVEIYRNEVRIVLPLEPGGSPAHIDLIAVSQGCADVGVCYVPHEQKARLSYAAYSAATGGPFVSAASDAASPFIDVPGRSAPRDDQ